MNDPIWTHKGTDLLRRGRVSIPGARYFVTVCTERRRPGLQESGPAHAIIESARDLQRAKNLDLLCLTVMPDHLHLLFVLGRNLTLSQTIRKLKSSSSKAIKHVGLSWQENFYDHRLRQMANLEKFALYIFLNPYRKGLVSCHETWPWWVRNRNYRPEFSEHLEENLYPPEAWLESSCSARELLEQDSSIVEKDP